MVALTYTEAASRVTFGIHQGAKVTVHSIRDASTNSIEWMAHQFQQNQLGERLVQNENHRHVFVAAGNVGMASMGAVAIVGEALWDATRQVAHKTSYVAADVVRYKYGEGTGRLVEHASDTTGNVVRTAAHVTMLEASMLAKVVAKNSSKVQVRRKMAEREQSDSDDDDNEVWDGSDEKESGTTRPTKKTS